MSAVPFSIKHLYAGLAEAEGLTWLENDALVLEYRVKDLTHCLCSSVREVRLNLQEVDDVQFENRLWRSPRISLRMRSLYAARRIPHSKGCVQLRIPKEARSRARSLANRITLTLSEYKLEWLEHEHRRLQREGA